MKNSRKAKQYYTLLNRDGREVSIDLNNYKVTCVATGKRKSFYHKYLYSLILTKYDGNIDTFRETYVSREAGPNKQERQVQQLRAQIDRTRARLASLTERLASIDS